MLCCLAGFLCCLLGKILLVFRIKIQSLLLAALFQLLNPDFFCLCLLLFNFQSLLLAGWYILNSHGGALCLLPLLQFFGNLRHYSVYIEQRQEDDKELKCDDLKLSVGRHKVCWKEEKVELTRKEFELLQYLMENKGLVMTRNQILCHVWGYDFDGETRTVDVHVRTLRQKLGEAGNLIETVRGVGYRIGA